MERLNEESVKSLKNGDKIISIASEGEIKYNEEYTILRFHFNIYLGCSTIELVEFSAPPKRNFPLRLFSLIEKKIPVKQLSRLEIIE